MAPRWGMLLTLAPAFECASFGVPACAMPMSPPEAPPRRRLRTFASRLNDSRIRWQVGTAAAGCGERGVAPLQRPLSCRPSPAAVVTAAAAQAAVQPVAAAVTLAALHLQSTLFLLCWASTLLASVLEHMICSTQMQVVEEGMDVPSLLSNSPAAQAAFDHQLAQLQGQLGETLIRPQQQLHSCSIDQTGAAHCMRTAGSQWHPATATVLHSSSRKRRSEQ